MFKAQTPLYAPFDSSIKFATLLAFAFVSRFEFGVSTPADPTRKMLLESAGSVGSLRLDEPVFLHHSDGFSLYSLRSFLDVLYLFVPVLAPISERASHDRRPVSYRTAALHVWTFDPATCSVPISRIISHQTARCHLLSTIAENDIRMLYHSHSTSPDTFSNLDFLRTPTETQSSP